MADPTRSSSAVVPGGTLLADGTRTMRGERMEREIREQAELLPRLAEGYLATARVAVAAADPQMVLLVARGSSDNAALYARYLVEVHLGIPALLAAPSAITRYGAKPRYPRTLAIGISQSGAAPDVSEVLATMRELGHATLAITNTANSRLGASADATLLLEVGEETAVAATKTFSASL
ncbi:SIS domain-containing protein, partial [bacterium]